MKNAIDGTSRGEDSPLLRKTLALMGASTGMWGAAQMQVVFHPVFVFLDMRPVYQAEVLMAKAAEKFDSEGKLSDVKAKENIRKKLAKLKEQILQGKK